MWIADSWRERITEALRAHGHGIASWFAENRELTTRELAEELGEHVAVVHVVRMYLDDADTEEKLEHCAKELLRRALRESRSGVSSWVRTIATWRPQDAERAHRVELALRDRPAAEIDQVLIDKTFSLHWVARQ